MLVQLLSPSPVPISVGEPASVHSVATFHRAQYFLHSYLTSTWSHWVRSSVIMGWGNINCMPGDLNDAVTILSQCFEAVRTWMGPEPCKTEWLWVHRTSISRFLSSVLVVLDRVALSCSDPVATYMFLCTHNSCWKNRNWLVESILLLIVELRVWLVEPLHSFDLYTRCDLFWIWTPCTQSLKP